MHGAALARALKRQSPETTLVGMGGLQMRDAGVRLLADITRYSTIGFLEPIRYLPKLLGTFFVLKTWIVKHRPDVIVLIDNQGFNMMLASVAKEIGIPTCYYIAPQEWQWGSESGGRRVATGVSKILSILKPEHEFYKKLGADVRYVGHPILDTAVASLSREEFCLRNQLDPNRPILGVFPGSRQQELTYTAPVLFAAAKRILASRPDVQVVVSVASPHYGKQLAALCVQSGLSPVYCMDNVNLIAYSYLSIVTSGTVSFEHALLGTPCLVCYQFSPLSYWFLTTFFAKKVKRIKFMSMANLIADREVLPEFLQAKATPERISAKAIELLASDSAQYAHIKSALVALKNTIGEPGVLDRAATEVLSLI